jgi:hypothetical protein
MVNIVSQGNKMIEGANTIMGQRERIASASRARNFAQTKQNKSSPRTGMRQLLDPSLKFVRLSEQVYGTGPVLSGVVG